MTASPEHRALVDAGARWLRRSGFPVVATEIRCCGLIEQPDVIGFRESCAVVLEAKASRADFLADRAKPHRLKGGVGRFRFFIVRAGLVHVGELPERWGLIEVDERGRATMARGPRGNIWSAGDPLAFPSDPVAERAILYSIARRAKEAA